MKNKLMKNKAAIVLPPNGGLRLGALDIVYVIILPYNSLSYCAVIN